MSALFINKTGMAHQMAKAHHTCLGTVAERYAIQLFERGDHPHTQVTVN